MRPSCITWWALNPKTGVLVRGRQEMGPTEGKTRGRRRQASELRITSRGTPGSCQGSQRKWLEPPMPSTGRVSPTRLPRHSLPSSSVETFTAFCYKLSDMGIEVRR